MFHNFVEELRKPSGTTKIPKIEEMPELRDTRPTFTVCLPYARIYVTHSNPFLQLELHHLDELNTRVSSVLHHEHVKSLHAHLGSWLKIREDQIANAKPK